MTAPIRRDLATVTVARRFAAPPATVFAALSDPVAMAVRASPAPSFRVTIALHEFRAGGVVTTLTPEGTGTRLQMDEHGCFPDGRDGAAMNEAGWGQVLDQLGTWSAG